MKPPFKIIALLFFTLFISNQNFAQTSSDQTTPEERAQKWDTWMKEELAIRPDQESTLHEINLKYAMQNETLRDASSSRRNKFQELKSSSKRKEEELKKVLTNDQFKNYQLKKKDFQRQMIKNYRN